MGLKQFRPNSVQPCYLAGMFDSSEVLFYTRWYSKLHVKIPGGGGTPSYGLYGYVRHQRIWILAVLVINRVSVLTTSVSNGVWRKLPFHH